MIARAHTVAFAGIEARHVEVQCSILAGTPGFTIVGMANKSISEARERIRAALNSLSIALPNRRITINLSPADLPKEGSHFDLPIALALLVALKVLPSEEVERTIAIGELSLDGKLAAVTGALPAAFAAAGEDKALICPGSCGAEAAWVSATDVFGARSLSEVMRHFTGEAPLAPSEPSLAGPNRTYPDLRDVKGQEKAKRALEIAAAGRHHLLMTGSPGAGKSMLAARLPGILPPLSPSEALETAMVHSLAGELPDQGILSTRPFRDPHHSASVAALTGGGRSAQPGEIALAHNGVLFLDELPEFPRNLLETLRQPLETGEILIARATAHIRYPCRFLLVAAANPCRCGHLADAAKACGRAPLCSDSYMGKISGPLMDRFDLRIEVPAVEWLDLDRPSLGETSAQIAQRVARARQIQAQRFAQSGVWVNADLQGESLEEFASPCPEGRALLNKVADKFGLSARGYHRILRVARTIADLEGAMHLNRQHIAEAASYRLPPARS